LSRLDQLDAVRQVLTHVIIILQSRKGSFEYRIEDLAGNVLKIFKDIDEAKLWLRVMRRVV
jgi:hypothetical protein